MRAQFRDCTPSLYRRSHELKHTNKGAYQRRIRALALPLSFLGVSNELHLHMQSVLPSQTGVTFLSCAELAGGMKVVNLNESRTPLTITTTMTDNVWHHDSDESLSAARAAQNQQVQPDTRRNPHLFPGESGREDRSSRTGAGRIGVWRDDGVRVTNRSEGLAAG